MSNVRGTYNNLCNVLGEPFYVRRHPIVEVEWKSKQIVHVGFLLVSGIFSADDFSEKDYYTQMSWEVYNVVLGNKQHLSERHVNKLEDLLLRSCTAREILTIKEDRRKLVNEGKATHERLRR